MGGRAPPRTWPGKGAALAPAIACAQQVREGGLSKANFRRRAELSPRCWGCGPHKLGSRVLLGLPVPIGPSLEEGPIWGAPTSVWHGCA